MREVVRVVLGARGGKDVSEEEGLSGGDGGCRRAVVVEGEGERVDTLKKEIKLFLPSVSGGADSVDSGGQRGGCRPVVYSGKSRCTYDTPA